MANYIVRRLLMVPLLLFGVSVLVFALMQFLTPIERSALYLRDVPHNEAAWDAAIKTYGLDKPIYVQYWNWLMGVRNPASGHIEGGILRGNLGYSRTASQFVVDMIAQRFPATLELTLWTVVPLVGIGIWLGVLAAVNHNKPIDQAARVFSIVGWSFPSFVFGLLVLMLFYAKLRWFPPGRVSDWVNLVIMSPTYHQYTHLITIDALLNLRFDIFLDGIRHMILPILTLSYINWAQLLRVTRSSMLETLRQDYVTTARAKGMPEQVVINQHARPNALIPVVTLAGLTIAGLLGGVIITETIFNYPGIGSAAAAAAAQLDVITVLGLALLTGLILAVANVIVDVLYVFIDPRVTLD